MPKHTAAAKASAKASVKASAKAKKALKPSPQVLSAVHAVHALADDHSAWAADPPAQLSRLHAALSALRTAQRPAVFASVLPHRTRADLDALTAWLRARSVDLDAHGLRLNFTNSTDPDPDTDADADVTVFATRPLTAGDCLLRVPAKLALRPDPRARPALRALGAAVPAVLHNTSLALIVTLLLEAADPHSPFAPYIRALPTRPPIPFLTFDATDMLALAPSPAAPAAVNTLRAQTRSYAAVYAAAARLRDPHLTPALLSYANWEWAVAVVMTRQNELPPVSPATGPPVLALVPVWDMCNHGDGSAASAFVIENDEPRVELTALRDFVAGDRVDMFYGRRPNVQLLQFSGFVAQHNPYDELPVDVAIDADDALLAQFKARVLAKRGVTVDQATATCRVKIGFGLRALHTALGVAAIACATKERLAALLKEGGPLVRELKDSSQAERDAIAVALRACIAEYPSQDDAPDTAQRRQVASLHAVELAFLRDALSQLDDVSVVDGEPTAAVTSPTDATAPQAQHCCGNC